MRFKKNSNNQWTLESWDTLRSNQGNADEFTYPYYGYYNKK